MSKSANEHEAAAALAMARRLMDQYGFDQTDIDLIDVGEAHAPGGGAWTPARWETFLATTIVRAIPCERISSSGGWSFIGLTPSPEIAAYAFTSLYRQLKRARADYIREQLKRVKSPRRKTARADAYAEGWVQAVYSKIAALYPQQETSEIVRTFIAKRFPHLTNLKPRAAAATGVAAQNDRDRGWMAGRAVELNHAVETSKRGLLT